MVLRRRLHEHRLRHCCPSRPPRSLGFPTTYSQQIVDLLVAIIRSNGISDSGAAGLAGVHPSTVFRWKRDTPTP